MNVYRFDWTEGGHDIHVLAFNLPEARALASVLFHVSLDWLRCREPTIELIS